MLFARRTVALVVAAGSGSRLGGEMPKQFRRLGGRPLLDWSVSALSAHTGISDVVVIVPPDQVAAWQDRYRVIAGGSTRQQSVHAGLEAVARLGGADAILIHDAARPFLSAQMIDALLAALEHHAGVVPALPVVDSLRESEAGLMGGDIPRGAINRIQTPQAFSFDAILNAHRQAVEHGLEATDDAQLLALPVALVAGDERLFKVTTSQDWERAAAHVQAALGDIRTGTGFDAHRFGPGDHVWLCGVMVPNDSGVIAHSDGDVALHALTDAVLGAIGDGDIGSHFPPSDPQWKDAPSDRFLCHACDRVAARGGMIANLDITIIAERPRIGPHRDAMRARLSELIGLEPDRISIKATTTEQLGFTGRREGIAAQAIATVRLP